MPSNLEIVREHYAAGERGDLAGMLAPVTARTTWTEMEGMPFAGTYVGPDAIIEGVFKRIGSEWEGFRFEPDALFDAGTAVIATGRYLGTCRATGKALNARVAHLWVFESGVLQGFEQFADTKLIAEAMH